MAADFRLWRSRIAKRSFVRCVRCSPFAVRRSLMRHSPMRCWTTQASGAPASTQESAAPFATQTLDAPSRESDAPSQEFGAPFATQAHDAPSQESDAPPFATQTQDAPSQESGAPFATQETDAPPFATQESDDATQAGSVKGLSFDALNDLVFDAVYPPTQVRRTRKWKHSAALVLESMAHPTQRQPVLMREAFSTIVGIDDITPRRLAQMFQGV